MSSRILLRLLTGFQMLRDGKPITLPMSAQRLLAFVGLQDRPVKRNYVAGALWMDSPEQRAGASLRSALWRLRQHGLDLLETEGDSLRLSPAVTVDVKEAIDFARRIVSPNADWSEARNHFEALSADLLPDWYDDWVVGERERFRQIRLHALETMCTQLTQQRRFAEAVEAGLAAVRGEPLRESAHRCLITAHLAEGNRTEARRHYERFRNLLAAEVDGSPSQDLDVLIYGREVPPGNQARYQESGAVLAMQA